MTGRGAIERLLERARTRHDRRDESGSLILDILIGMAIFALIAIIAVSAIGQYRMRAYVQSAVSDAEAVANAVQAAITDAAGDDAAVYPTGLLDAAALDVLEVTPTGKDAQAAAITVTPASNVEAFDVCVEYRGAYAVYVSDAGLADSGVIADDGFGGCAVHVPDGGSGGPDGPAACDNPQTVNLRNSYLTGLTSFTPEATWEPGGYLYASSPQNYSYTGLDMTFAPDKAYTIEFDWQPGSGAAFGSLITYTLRDDHDLGRSDWYWQTEVAEPPGPRRIDSVTIEPGVNFYPVAGHAALFVEIPRDSRIYGVTVTEACSALPD